MLYAMHRSIVPSRIMLSKFITPPSPYSELLTSCFYKTLSEHDSVRAVIQHLPAFEFGMVSEAVMREHFKLTPSGTYAYDAVKYINLGHALQAFRIEIKSTRTHLFRNINTRNNFDILMCCNWVNSGYSVYIITRYVLQQECHADTRFSLPVTDVQRIAHQVSSKDHLDIVLRE